MNNFNKSKSLRHECDDKRDVFFRKVTIAAVFGDEKTGTMKPENGAYRNAIVYYEESGSSYIYDSDGVYTKLNNIDGKTTSVVSVNGKTSRVTLVPSDLGADTSAEVNAKIVTAMTQIESEIPTKTSELENDSDYVSDPEYVHTDNNFTTEEKTKLSGLENYDDTEIRGEIEDIQDVIPAQAAESNQLADKDFVNSSLNSITAFYITKDAAGTQFATYAELAATTVFYSGGEVRVPTRNDYCIVLADETKTDPVTGENPTTRYIYQANGWEFQYIVNKTTLTAAQLATLNSGFVAADRTKLNGIEAGAQKNVQSNWTQTSTSADDFIKNKPENLVQDANYVHTDNNYTTTEKNKLAGVESGAQVNVLEEVQINGADQTITGKKVNIPTATDSTFGVVKSSTNTFKVLTSAEYDALTTHDPNTLYLVRGE